MWSSGKTYGMVVNFLRRRQPADWSSVKEALERLSTDQAMPHSVFPDDPSGAVCWNDGIGISTFLNLLGPPVGWRIDLKNCILSPNPQGDLNSTNVLNVTRGFSRRALANGLARFHATASRPYDTSDRSRRLMLDILDSDDLVGGRYSLSDLIGSELMAESEDPEEYSLDPEILSTWLADLNEHLANVGYESLWAKAYRNIQ